MLIPRKIVELWERPLKNGSIINNQFKITRFIGKGSYGLVYQAIDETTSQMVVVKQLRNRKRNSNEKLLIREARMLESLNLINTPRLVDYFYEDHKYFLIMEHKPGNNFEDLVIYEGKKYNETECIKILLKVLQVIRHLHAKRIIHRDLRLPNILLNEETIYVIDFGLALFVDEKDSGEGISSSLEKRLFREVSVKSDFYALGHFFLFLLYSTYETTTRKERSWEEELTIDPRLKKIIRKMLQLEASYETVDEIIKDLEVITEDNN
ncbi:serine/threonine protein kinase [Litchfieldia salsa]|uniref:Serine/threonine protein kinase n=1 Tax=Litchfieldia salsa TaxID=930152 RepID=A0A1H0WC25_9BACI|nr:protein kinase [Litchfieldia salsa]SDP88339.1 serine/threonine protein kinase [Litchfieldia salsa]